MVEVWFYEKPGCINNTKQKKLLMQSGHKVISHNLLEVDWDVISLRMFFGDLAVSQWFNRSSPSIKDGWIDPETLDETQAINLMIAEPILIRRPLMRVGNACMVGFDFDCVDKWIGLVNAEKEDDLETCTQQSR